MKKNKMPKITFEQLKQCVYEKYVEVFQEENENLKEAGDVNELLEILYFEGFETPDAHEFILDSLVDVWTTSG